jgi:phage/plasmid-associated DNA primase
MTREWEMTEATKSVAFLSDFDGDDVAVLERLPANEFETSAPIDEDEWQAMVNLVAAAPKLLAAAKGLLGALNRMGLADTPGDTFADLRNRCDELDSVISDAEHGRTA